MIGVISLYSFAAEEIQKLIMEACSWALVDEIQVSNWLEFLSLNSKNAAFLCGNLLYPCITSQNIKSLLELDYRAFHSGKYRLLIQYNGFSCQCADLIIFLTRHKTESLWIKASRIKEKNAAPKRSRSRYIWDLHILIFPQ